MVNDFTIKEIIQDNGIPIILEQPMPFIHIPAKGNSFIFQDKDGSEYGPEKSNIITFAHDYWLCAYPTTQEFWEAVVIRSALELLGSPSYFKGKTRPVERVSWDDIQIFNKALNELLNQEKLIFDLEQNAQKGLFGLPSETQWEYAALAGSNLVYTGSDNLNDVGWYDGNSNGHTMPVGLKQPNANGLYDMNGNVWEWCADDYIKDINKLPKNGNPYFGKGDYETKSLRGGGYINFARYCRLRNRYNYDPDDRRSYSFRLCFSPSRS